MSRQESPANSLPRAPASEMAASPDEPALNCTQPAGGVLVPDSSAQKDDSATTAVAISVARGRWDYKHGEHAPARMCRPYHCVFLTLCQRHAHLEGADRKVREREDTQPVLQGGTTPDSETPNKDTELVKSEDEAHHSQSL
ncbi:hypothetical protein AUP68_18056 [Ilyonectria robusta]